MKTNREVDWSNVIAWLCVLGCVVAIAVGVWFLAKGVAAWLNAA